MIKQVHFNELRTVGNLGDKIYSNDFYESYESLVSKFNFYYQGIYGYYQDNKMIGYIVSHPWDNNIVPLNFIINKSPKKEYYYIHDVAILPDFRNKKLGRELTETVIDHGVRNGFNKFILVSVNDTVGFWEKFGFAKDSELKYGNNQAFKMIYEC